MNSGGGRRESVVTWAEPVHSSLLSEFVQNSELGGEGVLGGGSCLFIETRIELDKTATNNHFRVLETDLSQATN